jgi:hypothetical protein
MLIGRAIASARTSSRAAQVGCFRLGPIIIAEVGNARHRGVPGTHRAAGSASIIRPISATHEKRMQLRASGAMGPGHKAPELGGLGPSVLASYGSPCPERPSWGLGYTSRHLACTSKRLRLRRIARMGREVIRPRRNPSGVRPVIAAKMIGAVSTIGPAHLLRLRRGRRDEARHEGCSKSAGENSPHAGRRGDRLVVCNHGPSPAFSCIPSDDGRKATCGRFGAPLIVRVLNRLLPISQ